jgi:hypothetical protein
MSRIFSLVFAFAVMVSGLYGTYVPGTLTFTFTPNGAEGTSGSWKAVVFTENGTEVSTDTISYSSTDIVTLEVASPVEGLIELGNYVIELVCNIDGTVTGPFLNSISVQCASSVIDWDTMTYKNLPTLTNGENTMIIYSIPEVIEDFGWITES